MSSEVTWPVEFADFKRLDAVLKCGICYDYMTNCMITSCSHTYCSLCIRKFMQYKNQCPACYEETYEVHLRNNRPLDEVITIFVKMKDKLQRALRLATIPIPVIDESASNDELKLENKTPKNKTPFKPKTPSLFLRGNTPSIAVRLFKEQQDESTICPKSPAHSSTKDNSINSSSLNTKVGEDVVLNGVKIPGIFNAPVVFPKIKKPEETASCPVCQVMVPAKNINMHLDSCLAVESEVCPKATKVVKKRDPIPKRLYHLMQEKGLKKVLKELGLSTQGDRKVLITRIQRYTVIYNAENDAPSPRPVSELIAQLEREERDEKKPTTLMKSLSKQQQQQPRPTIDRKSSHEAIEQANKAYREENKDSFKKLIEEMRMREGRSAKTPKQPTCIISDEEDSPDCSVQFDPNVPSTSKDSIYSQMTECSSNSDSDIFQEENSAVDERVVHEDENVNVLNNDEPESVTPNNDSTINCSSASHESKSPYKSPKDKVNSFFEAQKCEQSSSNAQPNNVEIPRPVDNQVSAQNKDNSEFLEDSIEQYESEDSIDALFEHSKTYDEERNTPQSAASKMKSKITTPSSANRGTKRKSNVSPKSASSLQETFDHLFQKYEGDKVDDNVESDDDIGSKPLENLSNEEQSSTPLPRRTRRSTRIQEKTPTNRRDARKRAKRDVSPVF